MPVGKSTRNVFSLVHHFGDEEDQLSANFGFILKSNEKLIPEFLKLLGLPVHTYSSKDIKSIDIERLALENNYKPSTASRCMRKLSEEGKLEKKYVNGAVSYRVPQKIQISQYQNNY